MIARVSLEIALRKEFDYLIPAEFAGQIDVGSRVQVPFGARKILGVVTAVAEESGRANLKPILKVIGAQTLVHRESLEARAVDRRILHCCAPEIALKSVLPEAVRKEDAGWRERLFVHALPVGGEFPKLSRNASRRSGTLSKSVARLPLAELLNSPKPPPPPSASWKIAASSQSRRKFPSATRMAAEQTISGPSPADHA